MIVCDIEIVTSSSGTRTRYAARGRFYEEGDGFVLCYLQDGDTVRLSVRERTFCMERRGETEISLSLAEGAAGFSLNVSESTVGPKFNADFKDAKRQPVKWACR